MHIVYSEQIYSYQFGYCWINYNTFKSDNFKIKFSMIQGLLENIQGPQLQDNISKVVKIKCFGDFFNDSSCVNTPIFYKRCFKFDKYELQKIMSFEYFDFLFLPFKTNSNYQKYMQLKELSNKFPLLIICFILLQLYFLNNGASQNMLLTFIAGAIAMPIAFLFYFLYLSDLQIKSMKDLKEFTADLDADGVEIKMTTNKDIGWCEWLRRLRQQPTAWSIEAQNTYFIIKSRRVKEEFDYVKLYCKSPAGIFCPIGSTDSVIQQSQFQFSQEKLNAFLPFKEIQQLMQPFASNQFYRKRIALFKTQMISILLLYLLLIPALLLIKVQAWQLFAAILDTAVILVVFGKGQAKLERLRSDIVDEFREHCRRVSNKHEKVEIIAKLCEGQTNGCFDGQNKLFCLQVRYKEAAQQ